MSKKLSWKLLAVNSLVMEYIPPLGRVNHHNSE